MGSNTVWIAVAVAAAIVAIMVWGGVDAQWATDAFNSNDR